MGGNSLSENIVILIIGMAIVMLLFIAGLITIGWFIRRSIRKEKEYMAKMNEIEEIVKNEMHLLTEDMRKMFQANINNH